MSLGRPNTNDFISPETFVSNQTKIEQARQLLEEMEEKNRLGLQKYTEREQQQRAVQMQLLKKKEELQKKIQEGLEAQRLIEELERRQSNLPLQLTPTETPSVGSATIEEVEDNNQPPVTSEIPVSSHHNINPLPQVQRGFSHQLQPYSSQPLHVHAPASIFPPSSIYHPYSSLPAALPASYQQASGSAHQQTYSNQQAPNYHAQTPLASAFWHSSQSSNNIPWNNSASSHTAPQHQVLDSTVYQPNLARPSKSDGLAQTGTAQHGISSPSDASYQGQRPRYVSAHATSGLSNIASQPLSPSQIPKPQASSHSVDSYGVPYVPFSDEQIVEMQRRVSNWQRQALPGAIEKIHEVIYLHKDTTKEATTWIYVPETPDSKSYSRTSEIDKFFNFLLNNSRLARTNTIPPTPDPTLSMPSSSNSAHPSKTLDVPTAVTVQQVPKRSESRASIPSGIPNPATINPPSGSTPASVRAKYTPPTLTPASNKEISGLTRRLPLPVDKKHLSQNLLFALGKRLRTGDSATPDQQPAKKHATNVSIALQQGANTAAVSSASNQMRRTQPSTTSSPSAVALKATPSGNHMSSNESTSGVAFTGHHTPRPDATSVSSSAPPKASSAMNVSSGIRVDIQSTVAPVTTSENSQRTIPSNSSSLQFNPYTPLLSLKVNSAPQSVSMLAPKTIIIQRQDQSSKTGAFPVASGSSHPHKKASPKQKEPLFLPSSSPERGASVSVIRSGSDAGPLLKAKKTRKEMFVLVPEPPEYLVRMRQRTGNQSDTEITRKQFQRLRAGTSSLSTSVIDKEVLDSELKAESRSDTDNSEQRAQRKAIHLACSRLQQVPCRWNGCSVVLNSINALIKHLNTHKPARSATNSQFTCRWAHCGRMCRFDGGHLANHPLLTMQCAYKGCDESYRSGSQLFKHHSSKHGSGELKPSAEPTLPNVDAPPTVPSILPAYLLATRMAKPATITPDRHEILCPWVIRNIVNSDQEKPTRLRTRKTAKAARRPIPTAGSDYEFITTRSTRYSSYLSQAVDLPLEDLDPATVSQMVDEGLVLWSSEDANLTDEPQHDDVLTSLTPMVPSTQTSGIVKEEVVDAPVRHISTSESVLHRREHSSGEDAVKAMLTGQ